MKAYLVATQVGDCYQRTSNVSSRRECGRVHFNGLVIRGEIGRHTDDKRDWLKLNCVVLREFRNLCVQVINCGLVSLGSNDAVLLR
jgi:hypothetical protein